MRNTESQLYALCTSMGETIKDLCREVERNTCSHEETHRGGVLWEICDQCGAKWADDEGGKPDYVEPKSITKATEVLDEWKNFNKPAYLSVWGISDWPETSYEDRLFYIFKISEGESNEAAIERAREAYGEDVEYIIK